jgi:hypothetical protein
MRSIGLGVSVVLLVSLVAGRLAIGVSAQDISRSCTVSGAKHPELMPDYFVWEFYFRTTTYTAKGLGEGLTLPPGKRFHPDGVRSGAKDVGVSEVDYLTFLQVGDDVLAKVDALRAAKASGSAAESPQQDVIDAVLDARDEIARRVAPGAMRAFRLHSPARGSVFDFPAD